MANGMKIKLRILFFAFSQTRLSFVANLISTVSLDIWINTEMKGSKTTGMPFLMHVKVTSVKRN